MQKYVVILGAAEWLARDNKTLYATVIVERIEVFGSQELALGALREFNRGRYEGSRRFASARVAARHWGGE